MEKYDEKTFLEMCKTASLESEKLERVGLSYYDTPEAKKILDAIASAHKEKEPSAEKPKETFYQKARRAAFRLQNLGVLYKR